jgi:hypothetical protein
MKLESNTPYRTETNLHVLKENLMQRGSICIGISIENSERVPYIDCFQLDPMSNSPVSVAAVLLGLENYKGGLVANYMFFNTQQFDLNVEVLDEESETDWDKKLKINREELKRIENDMKDQEYTLLQLNNSLPLVCGYKRIEPLPNDYKYDNFNNYTSAYIMF